MEAGGKKKKKASLRRAKAAGWGKHNMSKFSNYSDKLNATHKKKGFGNYILRLKVKNCFIQLWLRFVLSQPYAHIS